MTRPTERRNSNLSQSHSLSRARTLLSLSFALALLLFGTSCKNGEKGGGGEKPAEAPSSATRVLVIEVGRQTVPIVGTYPAQTAASQSVQVRPRVEGYLLNFSFREGSLVEAGQPLFQIDPAPFQAALEEAEATRASALASVAAANAGIDKANADLAYARKQVELARAQAQLAIALANQKKTDEDVARYKPLAKAQAIPQQTYDYALAAAAQARADVAAARAAVTNERLKTQADILRAQSAVGTAQATLSSAQASVSAAHAAVTRAQLNLSYTHITSPIRGMIGKLAVTPGNLVGKGEPTLLATVDGIDPMYANFSISEVDWLQYQGPSKTLMPKELEFEMLLADGSAYPLKGKYGMSARALEAETGTLMIRTVFPNPSLQLRPGQFVRIRVVTEFRPQSILIPQRAIMEFQALQTVYVVDAQNKVARRTVTLGERYKNDWVVLSGLKTGDKVIVEGLQKVEPGLTVIPETVPDADKASAAPVAGKASPTPGSR